VFFGQISSSSLNTAFLTSIFSTIASITTSQSLKSAILLPVDRYPSLFCISLSSNLPFSIAFFQAFLTAFKAFSIIAVSISTKITGKPASAAT
jgi:hypothetical protein